MSSKIGEHLGICSSLNELYKSKNKDYGDSFGKARELIPNYTLGKLYDKFNRYMTLSLQEDRQVQDETIEDTLLDLANYCIMEVVERRMEDDKGTDN